MNTNHPSKPMFISKGELLDKVTEYEKLIEGLKGQIKGLENTIKHLLKTHNTK
tara:strand:+ start:1117 stop:1275 length:159 start_codon:yes stop_codon:yes gene_type:complete